MAEYNLATPLDEAILKKLRVGDTVKISGTIFTARDLAHKYLAEAPKKDFPADLKGSAIYHCGPIMQKHGKNYEVVAAGPTTSSRMELYEPEVMQKYGIKAIIGKGGMGQGTLNALKKQGAVYLSVIGGIAALSAKSVKKVKGVYMLNRFGVPDAIWELEVEDFPAIVTMDSKGNNLHADILKKTAQNYKNII